MMQPDLLAQFLQKQYSSVELYAAAIDMAWKVSKVSIGK